MKRNPFQRLISCGLFVFFAFLASGVFAQNTPPAAAASSGRAQSIAPLLDEKTFVVVHFNLVELDFDRLLDTTIDFAERGLQARNLNAQQMTRIRLDLERSFNYIFREFREIRDRLVKEAGITDLYLVSYSDMSDKVPFFIAATQKDKSTEQRKAFARIIRSAFPIMFAEHGFMIGAAPIHSGVRKEAEADLRARIKNIVPADSAILNGAFDQQSDNIITLVGIFPPEFGKDIDVEALSTRFPKTLVQLAKFSAERIRWISVGFSIKNSSIKIVADTNSPKDAANIITAINRAAQLGTEELAKQAEATTVPEAKQQMKLFQDLIHQMRTDFLPTVVREKELQTIIDGTKPKALSQIVNPLLLIFMQTQQATWYNQCGNNFQTIYQAMEKYVEEKGAYPPAWTANSEGTPLHSWRVLLLPYLDEEELYQQIRLDEPWDSEHNTQFHTKMPTIFRCPASMNATNSTTTYAMVIGNDAFPPGPVAMKPAEVTDPKPATVLLVETRMPFCWMKPEDISTEIAYRGVGDDRGIGSNHVLRSNRPGGERGARLLFFDGSLRFVRAGAPLENVKSILTFRGGEDVQLDPPNSNPNPNPELNP